jgi:hypothetical protein
MRRLDGGLSFAHDWGERLSQVVEVPSGFLVKEVLEFAVDLSID